MPLREREPVAPVLERGDVPLERLARRILSARVLVPLVLPEPFLDVRRGQVHRRHDRAGEGFGALAGVNGSGAKARGRGPHQKRASCRYSCSWRYA